MSGSYLLDTNIIISLLSGETSTLTYLEESDEIFIPSIALGELHYGAHKSVRVQQNLERIEGLIADTAVLDCDSDTARWYGIVKDRLRAKGRPLPENDIWIASTALQHNLTLATRDAHFHHVESLKLAQW
ncbi:MAG: type II toxin-antitoxin system VapC family toxin [Cyanobacteria bacterium J06627_15]